MIGSLTSKVIIKAMKKILALIVINMFSLLGLAQQKITYHFDKPDAVYQLPDTLHEISGITDVDDGRIGCVQDERGIIFIYNLNTSAIEEQYTFYLDGDYEGITLVRDTMYVLRSDGMLFAVRGWMNGKPQRDSFITNIPNTNNEGLCFDPQHNRLLIASKNRINNAKEEKDFRYVYSFDLSTKKIMLEPLLRLNVNDIYKVALQQNIDLPRKTKKNGNLAPARIKFMPSGIAVHPISDEYYIISAVDRLMIVCNRLGEIKKVYQFDEKNFIKPEGITFYSNGDAFISNEGKDRKPNLLRFNKH